MVTSFRAAARSLRGMFAIACLWLLVAPAASADLIFNPFSAIKVSVDLEKGTSLSEAVTRILASAKENDQIELDPVRKGFGGMPIEIRDLDLFLREDLKLAQVPFGLAINRLCDASGAAFQFQGQGDEGYQFLFFRNAETASRDVFYDARAYAGGNGLIRRLKEAGVTPGPGECIVSKNAGWGLFPLRAGNRCHAAVEKILAEDDASH
ncbi:MAG: hypothetical protein JWO82_702 [Akkermansiaceae bacterium]|nr:hypothetical protein [Akkermansiaceae bacterium]